MRPPPRASLNWAARDRSCSALLHRAAAWPTVAFVLVAVSRLADGWMWGAVLIWLPLFGGANGTACALRLLLTNTINLLLYRIVKRRFARPRPFVTCPGIKARTRPLDEFSFPSGHTMHAVAHAWVLGAYYPSLAPWLWSFAALVALSRVVLGLHYASDVVVGIGLGVFTAASVLNLF